MADDPKKRPMPDKQEGIIRDPVRWQGQVVSYVMDIGNADPGYDANKRQVLITLADGSEKVVPEEEILRDMRQPEHQAVEIDRVPPEELPRPATTGVPAAPPRRR